jgi:DNA modification methylase
MGTGTTAVVAHALGREYMGFDISKEYVKFANQRVENGPYLKELVQELAKKKSMFLLDEED